MKTFDGVRSDFALNQSKKVIHKCFKKFSLTHAEKTQMTSPFPVNAKNVKAM